MHVTRDGAKVLAAVFGEVQPAGEREDPVRILRIDANVGVVERAEVDVRIAVDGPPAAAGVVAAPELSFVLGFADHVDNGRITGCDGHADAIHRLARQAEEPVGT